MRELILRAVVVLITCVFTLGIAEVALRISPSLIGIALLERFPPSLAREIATELGFSTQANRRLIASADRHDKGPTFFTYAPNQSYFSPVDDADKAAGATDLLTTDALGFCNPPGLAAGGKVDVLVIAGSLPNCAGTTAEQNFNVPLAAITGLSAYNMAVPRVGPHEYLETLRRFGLPLKPRIVLMAISEGNDLRDVHRFAEYLAGRRDDDDSASEESPGGILGSSYALSFLKAGFEMAERQLKRLFVEPDFRYSVKAGGARVPMNIANADLSELSYAKRLAEGSVAPDLFAPSMQEFVALGKEHGFVPLVVLVPAAYSAYADSVEYADPDIAGLMRTYSDAQRAWFRDNAAKLGYAYVDATPAMRKAAADGVLLFFPANVHLTAEGHRILAEAVAPAVEALVRPR